MRTGLPPALNDANCDLTLPAAQQFSPVFIAFIRLAIIQSQIYRRIYSASALTQTDAELLCTIRELDGLLEEWKQSIPTDSRPTFTSRPTDAESMLSSAFQLEYHYSMATIHQASGRCQSWTDKQNTRAQGSSLAISVAASRSLLGKFSELELQFHQLTGPMFYLPYLTGAMIHLFCNILLYPEEERSQSDLELIIEVPVRMVSQLWPDAPAAFRTQVEYVKGPVSGNLSYLYGTQFKESEHTHNLKLLYVDYDGGVVGQSVLKATPSQPSSNNCPTISLPRALSAVLSALESTGAPSMRFPMPRTISRKPWSMAAAPPPRRPWPTSGMELVTQLTLRVPPRSAYYANNASSALVSNVSALNVFLDPIQAQEINIKAANQGTRMLYNTVSMIMTIIMQFFFMMALNGISAQFNLFTSLSWVTNGFIRMCASVVYTFISALCMIGYIWAFREDWDVNGAQFVLSWITIWLYMHIDFLLFDIMTTFIPMQFMPFCMLAWMIANVSSTIAPFELSAGFYRWAYALPAHEAYAILGQIWSDGCTESAIPPCLERSTIGSSAGLLALGWGYARWPDANRL
ncbi:uncharacterized protein DSM5745_08451 [Aspergillus mulundensis]|uniref:DUF3533 domain-containing protein n=1 Tax=Aspergillus mulundensis TaxID=1810919 RepID=A0A3D8R435_9EURO|nr:hypothetical protein DSM5745_08451 [Aspergillus mulundensis]RDW68691.1 hypothetical protein DSM5745_08451 [Aspergillus mulundensis]